MHPHVDRRPLHLRRTRVEVGRAEAVRRRDAHDRVDGVAFASFDRPTGVDRSTAAHGSEVKWSGRIPSCVLLRMHGHEYMSDYCRFIRIDRADGDGLF